MGVNTFLDLLVSCENYILYHLFLISVVMLRLVMGWFKFLILHSTNPKKRIGMENRLLNVDSDTQVTRSGGGRIVIYFRWRPRTGNGGDTDPSQLLCWVVVLRMRCSSAGGNSNLPQLLCRAVALRLQSISLWFKQCGGNCDLFPLAAAYGKQ